MRKPTGKGIAARVYDIIHDTIVNLEYDVWDIEYLKEGADWILRVTIDKADGIAIEDCETVHHAIDPLLDAADPIEGAYDLEITSAGLERDLRLPEHFEVSIGSSVVCNLYAPKKGTKQLTGKLLSYNEGNIELETAEEIIPLAKKEYSKVETYYDFDEGKGKKKKF